DIFFSGFLELIEHRLLEVVGLDDAIGGEGFVHQIAQIGDVALHRPRGFADFAAINNNGYQAHRQHDYRDQCEIGLLRPEVDQQNDDGNGVFDHRGQRVDHDTV